MRVRDAVEVARGRSMWHPGVLLFGLPEVKDAIGSSSWDPSGPCSRPSRPSSATSEMTVMADVLSLRVHGPRPCGVIVDRDGVKASTTIRRCRC